MSDLPEHGVPLTAIAMAQDRAYETDQPDGLVIDPLARVFVAAAAPRVADTPLSWVAQGTTLKEFCPPMGDWVGLRTHYIDDFALDVLCSNNIRQVVIPAAGLDSRAFRLLWSDDVSVFEIDVPELIRFKENTLTATDARPRCTRVAIAADLRGDWPRALLEHGFQPDRPSLWLIEGLLMYLDDTAALMTQIARLTAPGSRLVADHAYPNALHNSDFSAGRQALSQNRSSFGETIQQPTEWMHRHGWDGAVATTEEIVASTGRQLPPVLDPARPDSPIFWLATAVRR